MNILNEPLVQALLDTNYPQLILLTDVPHFTIAASNNAFIDAIAKLGVKDGTTPSNFEALCRILKTEESYCSRSAAALTEAAKTGKRITISPILPTPDKQVPKSDVLSLANAQIELRPIQCFSSNIILACFRMPTDYILHYVQRAVTDEVAAIEKAGYGGKQQRSENTDKQLLFFSERDFAHMRTAVDLRFNKLVQAAPIAIGTLKGRNLVVESANDQLLRLWGKTAEAIGLPLAEALPELQGQPFMQILDDVYTTLQPFYGDGVAAKLVHQGEEKEMYFNFVYYPMPDEQEITRIMIVAIDVTEQVLIAKQVEASQRRLQGVVSTAPLGITVIRGYDLIVELANKPMLAIWNRMPEQIIGKSLLEVFPELHDQPFPQMLKQVLDTGQRLKVEEIPVKITSTAGEVVDHIVNFSYDPLFDDDGQVEALLAVVHDITEQVKARNEVAHAEELLRTAVEASELGTWRLDLQTQDYYASDRLKEIFGYLPEDEIAFEGLLGHIPEPYRQTVQQAKHATITSGVPYDQEFPVIGLRDNKKRWVKAIGQVYKNFSNDQSYFSGVKMDITDRKESEQRKNDFIGVVSHELKTPLTSLKGYVQILQAKAAKEGDLARLSILDKAGRQVDRMQRMINSFLSIAALESGKLQVIKERFNLNNLVKEIVADTMLMNPKFTYNLQAAEPLMVDADKDKIEQVLINLLNNAIKYSTTQTNIVVKCSQIEHMAQVSIIDQGMGISKENVEHLFERFYRVENDRMKHISGFGIGLYLCAEIITLHKGKIWVESELGKGSTFHFTLPMLS